MVGVDNLSSNKVRRLSDSANRLQRSAGEAKCFEDKMVMIMLSYGTQIAIAREVYSDEPVKLEEEIEFWDRMIKNSSLAVNNPTA